LTPLSKYFLSTVSDLLNSALASEGNEGLDGPFGTGNAEAGSGNGSRRFDCVVVPSAYKQMRSQRDSILSDIDEDNFDRAFRFFRPSKTLRWCTMPRILTKPVGAVIQGGSDMGRHLSESKLQQEFDFCGKLFASTGPEE